jgi:hypothetical protein
MMCLIVGCVRKARFRHNAHCLIAQDGAILNVLPGVWTFHRATEHHHRLLYGGKNVLKVSGLEVDPFGWYLQMYTNRF